MAEGRPNLRGARVLIVDDHADTRDILMETLPYCGGSVLTAGSASEAVTMLPDADVVVTDFSMPTHDGIWLLGEVRRLARRVPVVLLSGYAAQQTPVLASAGFDRILLKPIEPMALCAEIEAVLREAGRI